MSKPDKLSTHLERWNAAVDSRRPWDKEARHDLKVLNGKTWTTDELAVFEEQGRDPTNYNLVAGTMRLVAGVEAQSRTDPAYLGRGPADQEGAQAATKAGMMVRDQNSSNRQLSRQFWDTIVTGIGWMEVAGDPDPYSIGILERRVNPFLVWGDPCGKEPDMSDWIDVFRSVVTYPERLALRFASYQSEILGAGDYTGEGNGLSHSADWTLAHGDIPDVDQWDEMGLAQTEKPRQIRAVERWYRVEEWARLIRFRDGRVYEPNKLDINRADDRALMQMLAGSLVSKEARLVKSLVPRIRVAIFLPDEGGCLLNDAESPYSHNAFPFVPMWAYEDEYGRPVGLVRQQRCPQRDFNARMAHMLKQALNTQTWFEEGAFVDEAEALSEIAKPNGNIRLTEGGSGKVLDRNRLEAAPIESQMLEIDRNMIQEYSGVTPELMGQETNASSGTAIQSRQAQGQTRLYTLFDNRNWTQEQIAKELGLSTDQVGRIERGEVEPSLSLGARWARKCAVKLTRILGEVNRG